MNMNEKRAMNERKNDEQSLDLGQAIWESVGSHIGADLLRNYGDEYDFTPQVVEELRLLVAECLADCYGSELDWAVEHLEEEGKLKRKGVAPHPELWTLAVTRFGSDYEDDPDGMDCGSMDLFSLEQERQAKRLVERLNETDPDEYWGGRLTRDEVVETYDPVEREWLLENKSNRLAS